MRASDTRLFCPPTEPPISTPNCPRLYGIFAHPTNCRVFYSCWNGDGSKYECPPGLAYDNNQRVCVWADLVDSCDQLGEFALPALLRHPACPSSSFSRKHSSLNFIIEKISCTIITIRGNEADLFASCFTVSDKRDLGSKDGFQLPCLTSSSQT